MSDDAEEIQGFVIEDCSKSWSNASAARKVRTGGAPMEKRAKGKSGDAYDVRKTLESQEEHRLLREAGLDDQELDKSEREQLLVALRASLGSSQAAVSSVKDEQENEGLVQDSEMDKKQSSSILLDQEFPTANRVRRIDRGKTAFPANRRREEKEQTDLPSDTEVENLVKQQAKKRKSRRRVIESEEEGEDSSGLESSNRNQSSNQSSSMIHCPSIPLTEEQRQISSRRLLSLVSKVKSQQLTPIQEKRQGEEAAAAFSPGKLYSSLKIKSLDKGDERMGLRETAGQASLDHEGDGIQKTTKTVDYTKADGVTSPCVLELKVTDTNEEQPNPDMPCLSKTQEVSNPHKAEDASLKEAPLSSLNQEEEESDDKKPLPHDDFFCWCNTNPGKQMKRRYRRKQLRKEPAYFCPSPLMNPADYTKVILELFNVYFAQFRCFQRKFFKNRLSWGSPITEGSHHSAMVDVRKRGNPSLAFDFESDEEHSVSSPSPSVSNTKKNGQVKKHSLDQKRGAKGRDSKSLQSLTTYSTQTLETENTQPYDSNDELPDIGFALTQQLPKASDPGRGSENCDEEEMEIDTGEVQDNNISSSQSSGSLIIEDNSDSLQLQGPSDPKTGMVWKQDQDNSCKLGSREPENVHVIPVCSTQSSELKLISRKRKLERPPMDEDVLSISDEESEITFPQKKNFGTGRVHIEACSAGQTASAGHKSAAKNSEQQVYVTRSDSLLKSGGLCADDRSQPSMGTKTESRKDQSFASAEDDKNKAHVSDAAAKESISRRPRNQMIGKGHQVNEAVVAEAGNVLSIAEQTDVQVKMEVEEELTEVQCPMCFKSFPRDVVEHHAYRCQGSESVDDEGSEERPLRRVALQRSVKSDPLQRPLTRRPLHISNSRVTKTCTICGTQVMDVGFQQHYGICLKRAHRLQQHGGKVVHITRQESSASRNSPELLEETSNVESEDSKFDLQIDDTTKDPDFIP